MMKFIFMRTYLYSMLIIFGRISVIILRLFYHRSHYVTYPSLNHFGFSWFSTFFRTEEIEPNSNWLTEPQPQLKSSVLMRFWIHTTVLRLKHEPTVVGSYLLEVHYSVFWNHDIVGTVDAVVVVCYRERRTAYCTHCVIEDTSTCCKHTHTHTHSYVSWLEFSLPEVHFPKN